MDVEKTIEFILAQQARTEALLASLAEKQDAFAEKQNTLAENQTKADKQVRAIRKLIWAGMRIVVDIGQRTEEIAEGQKETDRKMRELADAHKQLMDILLRQHKNGN